MHGEAAESRILDPRSGRRLASDGRPKDGERARNSGGGLCVGASRWVAKEEIKREKQQVTWARGLTQAQADATRRGASFTWISTSTAHEAHIGCHAPRATRCKTS